MCVNSYLHGKNYDRLSISCLNFEIFRELAKVTTILLVHMNAFATMVTTVLVSYSGVPGPGMHVPACSGGPVPARLWIKKLN